MLKSTLFIFLCGLTVQILPELKPILGHIFLCNTHSKPSYPYGKANDDGGLGRDAASSVDNLEGLLAKVEGNLSADNTCSEKHLVPVKVVSVPAAQQLNCFNRLLIVSCLALTCFFATLLASLRDSPGIRQWKGIPVYAPSSASTISLASNMSWSFC